MVLATRFIINMEVPLTQLFQGLLGGDAFRGSNTFAFCSQSPFIHWFGGFLAVGAEVITPRSLHHQCASGIGGQRVVQGGQDSWWLRLGLARGLATGWEAPSRGRACGSGSLWRWPGKGQPLQSAGKQGCARSHVSACRPPQIAHL